MAEKKNGYLPRASKKKNADNAEEPDFEKEAQALYERYKDAYQKNAEDAMKDTIGKISALSGGFGSSYAQTAGNAAYDKQMSKLNEVIPTLYKLAYERYKSERAYRDGAEQQAFENAYKERAYNDSMAQKAWERAQSEKKYEDQQAQRAFENSQKESAAQEKNKKRYDYFDERLFADLDLTDEEKGLLDDAAYRYMLTGSEKWLESASSKLGEGRDVGEFFDYLRRIYDEKEEKDSEGGGKTDAPEVKEMTSAQVRTYVSNRDGYANEQKKDLGDTDATRSFALYLKAHIREGHFADPAEEIAVYLGKVIGPPDLNAVFDPAGSILSAAFGGYSKEQRNNCGKLLDIFVKKGCIGEKDKEKVLASLGMTAI